MIYPYICDTCDTRYEIYQKMNSDHKYVCPACLLPARRIYTAVPFKFTFWYGYDEGLDKYIDTKSQRDEILRKEEYAIV